MSFQVLSSVTPVTLADRVANLEAALSAGQVPGLIGVHNYAAYNVPATLTSGTDTTGIANQIWISEMRIDKNTLITGLSFLIGTVGGTDKAIAILYNAAGAILATSAVAGVVVGTLATFQRLPLITPYQAAPGLYYVGIQTNGTTAHIRTQGGGDHIAGIVTGQTFGTPTAIIPPTTFTASSAPYVMTY